MLSGELTFEPLDESHVDELYPEFSEEDSFRDTAGKTPVSVQALRTEFAGLSAGPAPGSGET
jgi:hypothetical protein